MGISYFVLRNNLQFTRSNRKHQDTSGNQYASEWELGVSKPNVPPLNTFIIEVLLTFLLVIVMCCVCDEERKDINEAASLFSDWNGCGLPCLGNTILWIVY